MLNAGLVFVLALFLQSVKSQDEKAFNMVNRSLYWKLKLNDPCTKNWEKNWFKDGLIAKVEQSDSGMNFIAGPKNRNDAHHGVLWSKESYKGDIKLEYYYTRTDSAVVNVNILYIQAQGIGTGPYDKDISKWNKLREVPEMGIYYNYMNPLHISLAAFPMVNEDPQNDYIRVRKYPISEGRKFSETEIPETAFKTGLFLPNVTYKITVIKTKTNLYFKIVGNKQSKLFSWKLKEGQSPEEGRIGLRHMFTRSARYKDFKIYTK
ncbi:hypothetical protein ADIARSV_2914 [Arcticibacter svalbardensis MN12-7]|uniref:DUF1961 family protein n=1 Tax=Arcticibacter svalbardensis MN12-7 TaxID=1150600 RepID=R9GQB9_9SPHI|nr:hypothetical protein [Arcticibacter svalbardensis]EOR93921.1 hypothetical protein ADIARSV_2914 [Arcticibacter svalbardensis MN12-7]